MKKSSDEFKQLQRDRIRNIKPWLKSTGAKTIDGKKKSSMNARGKNYELNQLVKNYKKIFRDLNERYLYVK